MALSFSFIAFLLLSTISAAFLLLHRTRYRQLGLPMGCLGLPLIGEFQQLISAYKIENPKPFIHERVNRIGSVFMTHLFAEPRIF
ncbi:unnamed protein product [Cochlearia groenlandica]